MRETARDRFANYLIYPLTFVDERINNTTLRFVFFLPALILTMIFLMVGFPLYIVAASIDFAKGEL